MKERAKQLADEHWGYISSLLATHGTDDTTMEIIGFHYNSAAIHFHGHGVEDERNRAKGVSSAAFENDTPITAYAEAIEIVAKKEQPAMLCTTCARDKACMGGWKGSHAENFCEGYLESAPAPPAREPLDLRLPSYALPCTVEEARAQWESEIREYDDAEAGSFLELVEAWDVLQAARTWYEKAGANKGRGDCENAVLVLTRFNSEGRPVARAGRAMLIKNAARGYYSPEDCTRILADV